MMITERQIAKVWVSQRAGRRVIGLEAGRWRCTVCRASFGWQWRRDRSRAPAYAIKAGVLFVTAFRRTR